MAQINKPTDYFNTKLYTGTGATQSITGIGFEPSLTWIKKRNGTTSHTVTDSVRGVNKQIFTNEAEAEESYTSVLTSFDSDGFSLSTAGLINASSDTYASWNWLGANGTSANTDGTISSTVSANTTSGFSICTYTGNGTSGATFGHGLNSAPEMVILKTRNTTGQWRVGHVGADSTFDQVLNLNLTNAKASASSIFNSTAPSSTVVTLGNEGDANGNNNTFVASCFHSVKGFSKFGGYTGNGSTDGTFVYTGFRPAFTIIKRTDSTSNWIVHDNKRNLFNVVNIALAPNLNNGESDFSTSLNQIDFLSNGFKLKDNSGDQNASGGSYIYMAFAENPLVGTNNIPATAR